MNGWVHRKANRVRTAAGCNWGRSLIDPARASSVGRSHAAWAARVFMTTTVRLSRGCRGKHQQAAGASSKSSGTTKAIINQAFTSDRECDEFFCFPQQLPPNSRRPQQRVPVAIYFLVYMMRFDRRILARFAFVVVLSAFFLVYIQAFFVLAFPPKPP